MLITRTLRIEDEVAGREFELEVDLWATEDDGVTVEKIHSVEELIYTEGELVNDVPFDRRPIALTDLPPLAAVDYQNALQDSEFVASVLEEIADRAREDAADFALAARKELK